MAIPIHNVAYYYGDTYTLIVNFNKADGTPIDLTTGTLQAWIVTDACDPIASKIGEWDVTIQPTHNQAKLTLTPDLFLGQDLSLQYCYDVQFTGSDNTVNTFFKGMIEVEPDITRTT